MIPSFEFFGNLCKITVVIVYKVVISLQKKSVVMEKKSLLAIFFSTIHLINCDS